MVCDVSCTSWDPNNRTKPSSPPIPEENHWSKTLCPVKSTPIRIQFLTFFDSKMFLCTHPSEHSKSLKPFLYLNVKGITSFKRYLSVSQGRQNKRGVYPKKSTSQIRLSHCWMSAIWQFEWISIAAGWADSLSSEHNRSGHDLTDFSKQITAITEVLGSPNLPFRVKVVHVWLDPQTWTT